MKKREKINGGFSLIAEGLKLLGWVIMVPKKSKVDYVVIGDDSALSKIKKILDAHLEPARRKNIPYFGVSNKEAKKQFNHIRTKKLRNER